MNSFKKSEMILFISFCLILLAGGQWVLSKTLKQKKADLLSQLNQAEQLRDIESEWLSKKEAWMAKKQWLSQQQNTLKDPTGSEFFSELQKTARQRDLKIESQNLLPPITSNEEQRVQVEMRLVGSMKNVISWLVELQQPSKLISFDKLSIKSAENEQRIVCEFALTYWSKF